MNEFNDHLYSLQIASMTISQDSFFERAKFHIGAQSSKLMMLSGIDTSAVVLIQLEWL